MGAVVAKLPYLPIGDLSPSHSIGSAGIGSGGIGGAGIGGAGIGIGGTRCFWFGNGGVFIYINQTLSLVAGCCMQSCNGHYMYRYQVQCTVVPYVYVGLSREQ